MESNYWETITANYRAFARRRDPVAEVALIRKKYPCACQLCGRRNRVVVLLRNVSTGKYLRVGRNCNDNRYKIADRWWDEFFRRERLRAWREGLLEKDLV
jgi:hypothetical protein